MKNIKKLCILVMIIKAVLLINLDEANAQTWARLYGETGGWRIYDIEEMSNGELIAAGYYSNKVWLFKMNQSGQILWEKTYNYVPLTTRDLMHKTSDNNFVLIGSDSMNVIWIAKIDQNGDIVWQKKHDWLLGTRIHSINVSIDGGYIMVGSLRISFNPNEYRLIVIKIDESGNVVWHNTFDINDDIPWDVLSTTDGGYLIGGGNDCMGLCEDKGMLIKLDNNGSVVWAKAYYGGVIRSIAETLDGSFILAGHTATKTPYSAWIAKVDASGSIQWQKEYGSIIDEQLFNIEAASDGYIAAGITWSFGSGWGDAWILKLDVNGNVLWQKAYGTYEADEAYEAKQSFDGGYLVVGRTYQSDVIGFAGLFLKLNKDGEIDQDCDYLQDTYVNEWTGNATESDIAVNEMTYSFISSDGTTVPTDVTSTIIEQCTGCMQDAYEYDNNCHIFTTLISGNESQEHNFCEDSEDWLKFNACAGRQYEIQTTAIGISTDTFIELYDADCKTVLAVDDNSGGGTSSFISWTAPSSGTFHIKVRQAQNDYGKNREYSIKLSGDTSPCSNWSRTYYLINEDTIAKIFAHKYNQLSLYQPLVINEGTIAKTFAQTSDGGFIIGSFLSWSVIKTDLNGEIQWQKKYPIPPGQKIHAVKQTSDGGYIIAGFTNYFYPTSDYVIKLDSYGNIQWQKIYIFSTIGAREVYDIEELKEGGYIMLVSSANVQEMMWLVWLNENGGPMWIKAYSDVNLDDLYSATDIYPVSDGGFVIAGTAFLESSDSEDIWVAKIDTSGNIVWQKTYAYDGSQRGSHISEMKDKGFMVIGTTFEGNGFVLMKIDALGNLEWQKMSEGVYEFDFPHISMQATKDGGAVVSGAISNGNEKDGFIMKVTADGEVEWSKLYDYQYYDRVSEIIQTNDSGYAVAGYTEALDQSEKAWVMKLDDTGDIPLCQLAQNITLTLSNVSFTVENSNAKVSELAWLTFDTSVTPQDTLADIEEQCLWGYIFLQPYLMQKPVVDDAGSPVPNGIIEPDEIVLLRGTLENIGTKDAINVIGSLTSSDPVVIQDPDASYGDIARGQFAQCNNCFELQAPLMNRPSLHWDFTVTESVFADSYGPISFDYIYHVGASFSDVPETNLFYSFIETILHSGISAGCGADLYCPDADVQRQQMGKFICNSMEIASPGSCTVLPCSGIFEDVPASNIFCSHIEALYNAGVVSGCQSNPLMYCPVSNIQRQSMAKLICLAMEYTQPGSCSTQLCAEIFDDVNSKNVFCPYIESLYKAGIISGCTSTSFCPFDFVSREQMAKFIVNSFELSM